MKRYINQAYYCFEIMERLNERIKSRNVAMLQSGRGKFTDFCQLETKENICRMIRQLRAELLELEGMIRNDK